MFTRIDVTSLDACPHNADRYFPQSREIPRNDTEAVNPLTPNDQYRGRTAPLTSKRCILYIYSTNIGSEYFKHGIYSHFFLFKMLFVS